MPGICAAVPVPPWTTETIIWFSSAALCGLIARPRFDGVVALIVDPSGATIFWTRYGFGTMPPLATVAATIAIWRGVATMLNWPNASRPGSTAVAGSFGFHSLPFR